MGRFERLVVQYPKDRDYRFELARTYALDDQYSRTSVTPERLETGIKKALPVIESLAAEAPDAVNYVMAQVRWKARLAGCAPPARPIIRGRDLLSPVDRAR